MSGVNRFVAVRFFLPGAGSTVEIYDRTDPNDKATWDKNQQLYHCQVVGYAASANLLVGFHRMKKVEPEEVA